MPRCNGSINSSFIIWEGRLGAVESCRVVVTRHSQCTCTAMNAVLIGWYMNINGSSEVPGVVGWHTGRPMY